MRFMLGREKAVGKSRVMGDGKYILFFHHTAGEKTKHFFRDDIAAIDTGIGPLDEVDRISVDE